MRNVLILTNHLRPGGITTYVKVLKKALESCGYNVFFASAQADAQFDRHYYLDIKGKNAFSLHNLFLYRRLEEIVKKEKIDLLWAHTRITSVIASVVSKKMRLPYLTTAHGFFKPNLGRRLFKCQGDYTIAISHAVKEHLIYQLGYDETKTRVIYNSLDPDELSMLKAKKKQLASISRDNLGLPKDGFVIGMLSRLSPVKGWDVAFEAIRNIFDVYLLFFTNHDRRYDEKLEKYLNLDELKGRVVCYQDSNLDKAMFWAGIDLFLMPSREEGFGLTALESLELGIPVLATNVGGLKEVVNNDVGFLVDRDDVEGISDTIKMILRDPDIMDKKKQNINNHLKRFSFDKFTKEICSLMQTLKASG